ncbi:hypothetical protein [Winogradskyella sp.]
MEKTRLIAALLIITIIFSCNHNEGNFMISNESDFDIDSLRIFPDSEVKVLSLKKNESVNYKTLMNLVKSDGSYRILFNVPKTNKTVFQKFGYFSNGYQTEDIINIKIMNDTILFDSEFKHLY